MSDSGYLTNQLLIAMPSMGDPNFAQVVALVCDHNERGALGLILVGVVVLLPFILGYTAFVYWLFRGKATADAGYH